MRSSASQLPLPEELGSDSIFRERDLRLLVNRLHRIIRDNDANSSLVERFDEASKILYVASVLLDAEEVARGPKETIEQHSRRLRSYFRTAVLAQPDLFPRRFRQLKLSARALSMSMDLVHSQRISGRDMLGLAYEELIRRTFDKSDHQQFFTPPTVVQAMLSVGGEAVRGAVCDPAAGTGGFLVAAAQQRPDSLLALEIDERLSWVAGLNLHLHGAANFKTEVLGDDGTLGTEVRPLFGTIDCILTNPPFGSDLSGPSLAEFALGRGRTSRRRGILFLERCIDLLRVGGTLLIVIDDGFLSLPSTADARAHVLSRGTVEAVISLPDSAFQPYASVSTSIIRLTKTQKKVRTGTFYARARSVGRKANGDDDLHYDTSGQPQLNSDLPRIADLYKEFSGVSDFDAESLLGSEPECYLSDVHSNVTERDNRFDFLALHPSRIQSDRRIRESPTHFVPLKDLCNVRSSSLIPADELADQIIPFTGLAQIQAMTGRITQIPQPANGLRSQVRRYQIGDILFSRMRPELRKIGLNSEFASGFASGECTILVVKEGPAGNPLILPALLAAILRSDLTFGQLVHRVAGIGRPRVSQKDLLSVLIPCPSAEKQLQLAERLDEDLGAAESLESQSRQLAIDAAKKRVDLLQELTSDLLSPS